ncbi:MAG: type II toxin-antitoxin system VapC family toxin [Gaiellaceae bacterium]
MIADSSVWIDFARDLDTPQVAALERTITDRTAMTTDIVRLEVLSGQTQVERLSAALDGCEDVMQLPRIDVEDAAYIYRVCRRAGESIRSLNDCLIAAIAIRNDVPVLHRDRDYEAIARHFPLRLVAG